MINQQKHVNQSLVDSCHGTPPCTRCPPAQCRRGTRHNALRTRSRGGEAQVLVRRSHAWMQPGTQLRHSTNFICRHIYVYRHIMTYYIFMFVDILHHDMYIYAEIKIHIICNPNISISYHVILRSAISYELGNELETTTLDKHLLTADAHPASHWDKTPFARMNHVHTITSENRLYPSINRPTWATEKQVCQGPARVYPGSLQGLPRALPGSRQGLSGVSLTGSSWVLDRLSEMLCHTTLALPGVAAMSLAAMEGFPLGTETSEMESCEITTESLVVSIKLMDG